MEVLSWHEVDLGGVTLAGRPSRMSRQTRHRPGRRRRRSSPCNCCSASFPTRRGADASSPHGSLSGYQSSKSTAFASGTSRSTSRSREAKTRRRSRRPRETTCRSSSKNAPHHSGESPCRARDALPSRQPLRRGRGARRVVDGLASSAKGYSQWLCGPLVVREEVAMNTPPMTNDLEGRMR
jgi:hypothetical protein